MSYRKIKDGTTSVNTFLSENLSGIKIIQIFNREERKKEEFKKKNPKLNLRIYCSGSYFTDDRYFKNILKQEPHELSKEERESICISDSFTNSHTENLNGKRVIVMTGHFDHDNEDVYRMEFNHNREASNTVISGGIEFSAPPAEYKQNLEEMKKAFKTIRWNNHYVCKP